MYEYDDPSEEQIEDQMVDDQIEAQRDRENEREATFLYERGRRAYEAYNAGGVAAFANKNFRGEPCPGWDDLPLNVRLKWQAAVVAISKHDEGEG